MSCDYDLCATIEKQLNGRKRGTNTAIVGDVLVAVEGDIEIRAKQNALSGKVTQGIDRPHGILLIS